jgi:hypothetical protein
MATDAYDYEYEHAGETVQVAVHCSGATHEPRIRWQVGDYSGEHGYIHLDRRESILRLEEREMIRFQDQLVSKLPVPRSIGKALDDLVVKLGTVTVEDSVTDPTAFPPEIDGFHRVGWENQRNVMWYWREEQSTPRAYQIENGELVFRAQEWADPVTSKRVLIDNYNITYNEI